MILFTIEMNHRRYVTTREDKAWDFCMRFGGEIIDREQTDKIVDGVEQVEKHWLEIWIEIRELISGRKVDLEWEKGFGSRVVAKPSATGRYKINEWPLDGD